MPDQQNKEETQTDKGYIEATRDPLTSFVNRQVLMDAMGRAISRARRGKRTTLMVIDIDSFKLVNDTFGAETGDRVLKEMTGVLKTWLRDEDMLARLGSDEFAALLEGEGLDGAEVAAERMRTAINGYQEADWNFSLSLSIGIVAVTGAADPETVLRWGDTAMYEAKQSGGDRVVRHKPTTI
jgi:diguanylate cyclase (GGDEF)-like protein